MIAFTFSLSLTYVYLLTVQLHSFSDRFPVTIVTNWRYVQTWDKEKQF